MELTNPKKLKKGDTIGIVSPSAGLAELFPHRVELGKKMLEKIGFQVVFASHSRNRERWVSGSPIDRASDLHQMFANDKVDAIMCTIGGDHSNQILKYLDFDLIRNNPKIFIGYSDITILHYAFAKKAGLRTFYGPCLMSEFGEYPTVLPYTLNYFKKALMNEKPIGLVKPSEIWTDEFLDWFKKRDLTRSRKLYPSQGYEWWREGKAKALIWGGAIPTVNHIAGSEYWVNPADKIFFIDIPEGDSGIFYSQSWLDSFLSDLDNLCVFASIKGLMIGRPYGYGQKEDKILKDMIMYYTEGYEYPVVYNVNIGHVAPIITLPFGATVHLDSTQNRFEILDSGIV